MKSRWETIVEAIDKLPPSFSFAERQTRNDVLAIVSIEREMIEQMQEVYVQRMTDVRDCDRERAERSIRELHQVSGLEEPKFFIWLDSPLQAAMASSLFCWFSFLQFRDIKMVQAWNLYKARRTLPLLPELAGSHRILPRHWHDQLLLEERVNALLPAITFFRLTEVMTEGASSALPVLTDSLLERVQSCWHIIECVSNFISKQMIETADSSSPLNRWTDVWLRVGDQLKDDKQFFNLWLHSARQLCGLGGDRRTAVAKTLIDIAVHQDLRGWRWEGQHNANIVAQLECCALLGATRTNVFDALRQVVANCSWFWILDKVCILAESPSEIHVDHLLRPHKQFGMAIRFRDGVGGYALAGTPVTEEIAMGQFTAEDIEREDNVEIRRLMTEMYGIGRYITDRELKAVHLDNFGVLYREVILGDEPLVVVQVKNATPEPDGSFKSYFLRVPPETRTAHEAVAWSFGLHKKQYRPTRET